MPTLDELAIALAAGKPSRELVDECLARIADPQGEGGRTFLKVHAEQARAAADYHDRMRRAGVPASRFAGIPVSIKDLFDIAGDVTTAGSIALRDAPPAKRDAPAVARLRVAGFIPIGRTNMTEFAFSGLGINPHYGTPLNPFDRAAGRIPGGSSSGAAVSVTDGMAFAGLGTDTGGSCRIPAALCGLVGYKPTARRVPTEGAYPLSTTLDSIGPIAWSVQCCATVDAVLAGEEPSELPSFPLDGLRLAIPDTMALDDLDEHVAGAFERSVTKLSRAGVRCAHIPLREFADLPRINAKAGFSAAQSYAIHRPLLATKRELYDPRVLIRILRGAEQDAADYVDLIRERADFIRRVDAVTAPYDALLMPTVARIAPPVRDLASDEAYHKANFLMLRNPAVVNFLDRCAISIPCHQAGDAPVGLMLVGQHGDDRRLLTIAAAVEALIAPKT